MRVIRLFFMSIVLGFLIGQMSYSDSRNYVWTYQYDTLPAGLLELEMYFTTEVQKSDDLSNSNWRQWFELEYGITKNTDIALYQKFLQSNGAVPVFQYDGFKLRLRHKVAKKDYLPIDVLFYIEYERSSDLKETDIIEWKEVFAKDIDKLNISYNMIFEYQPKNNWRYEHGYAFGISYEIIDNLRLGAEASGSYSNKKYYLGPTISLLAPEFFAVFGSEWGLNDNSNFLNVRLVIGIPLGK
ncbi:MAG: hypothetical protein A2452_06480 [Candidatus Firestonebacteria bacterium RIFOXYC2_FULL_39_67]|nr:MAG: hypothetical protein A2452_06480 [Candidatus Firestonebacteria bacterium RIFOXYC2_FULL_39_67]